jgi:glycosyltransferase involved in cell wall biosynthesis
MLIRLAAALDPGRVRPVVVCLRETGGWGRSVLGQSIPVHESILHHKFDLRAVGRLTRLLRQYRPACIMAVGSGGDRMFWSTLAARLAGAPVIVWSHLFPVPDRPEFEWVNRRLYPWVSALVALGQHHADALAHAAGAPRGRIRVIHNGIDPEVFDHPEWRESARCLLGLRPDEVAIALIANLRAIKRVDLFIDAAARLGRLRPETRFFIVGEGALRTDLEAQIARLGPIGANIQLLGAREDVPTLIQAFDIVCLTSLREVLSVAMLEAMAAGKAFVAPAVGSLDEALIDGETGRFFEPQTSDALAGVLAQLVADPAQRRRLGEAARAKVRAEFRLDQMARAFEDLVMRLCSRTA